MSELASLATDGTTSGFARKLGLFDVTMIVIGGIVGAGIFMNPSVVANQVHTTALILGAWLLGGVVALIGAFIYAELAWRFPKVGGQYVYIREAYHPLPAFMYGWSALLVIQTGGMAAVAVTFARYFLELVPVDVSDSFVAVLTIIVLTVINCLGVRSGTTTQNVLMMLKILAIAMLAGIALVMVRVSHLSFQPIVDRPVSIGLVTAFGAAMVPVLFAYGGWQTSNFVAGEIRNPRKILPRGLILGVIGVVVLYLVVNLVCVHALGVSGLAGTSAPASAVMRLALGDRGAQFIAVGIAISTLGFLSQTMLTAPRLYYAMAQDGLFFKSVARLSPRTHTPVAAIILQGIITSVIALSGRYDQILNYVVSADFIFFGLTATCVHVFRRRDGMNTPGFLQARHEGERMSVRTPGYPLATVFFTSVCWLVVANDVYSYPANTMIGIVLVLSGIPAYYFWKWWNRKGE